MTYDQIKNYKAVSFDIFGTLLLRKTAKPEDIFLEVGEKLHRNGILSEEITPLAFARLRQAMEARCIEKYGRAKGCIYNIAEIYDNLPCFLSDIRDEAVRTEIETEKENTYLNPYIYTIVEGLFKDGKHVYLTSDMYLPGTVIADLLENAGFDISIPDIILISCDQKASKVSGELYDILVQKSGIERNEIIHIGDNQNSDHICAKAKGIDSYYYEALECLPAEMVIEEYTGRGISSMRSLRCIFNEHISNRNDFWYREGALVWGPVLALYTDWVIDTAISKGIKNIYPMMREGLLLGDMFDIAIKARGCDLSWKRLYVSRETTVLAGFEGFNKELFDLCFTYPTMTVGGMLKFLGIDEAPEDLDQTKRLTKIRGTADADLLYDHLQRDEVKEKIRSRCAEKRKKLLTYLDQEYDTGHPFITCDIGFQGTSSYSIDKALSIEGRQQNTLHLMLATSYGAVNNVLNGSEIIGFLQDYESGFGSLGRCYAFSEALWMGDEGPTRDYTEKDGSWVPLLGEPNVTPVEVTARNSFRNGVLDFIRLYYKCVKNSRFSCTKKEAYSLLERLYKCPTPEEASHYVELSFEQNIGEVVTTRLSIDEEKKQLAVFHNPGQAAAISCLDDRPSWPEAIESLTDFPKLLEWETRNTQNLYVYAMTGICNDIKQSGITEVIIYGAGVVGEILVSLLPFYGITAICAADRNERLWGSRLAGKTDVFSPEQALSGNDTPVVIASLAHIDDISGTIREFGTGRRILAFQ